MMIAFPINVLKKNWYVVGSLLAVGVLVGVVLVFQYFGIYVGINPF